MTRNGLTAAARRHAQRVIGKLVRLEKGRFSIALGEALLPQSVDGLRFTEGLDVGEALLFAAHEQDGSYKERYLQTLSGRVSRPPFKLSLPGSSSSLSVRELVALASQASLMLERIALQRRVVQLKSGS